ncbi:MAG TPA: cyclase family protein [Burkholderiales bacterium]|nr:cyclase family protein [Burkholderiales bacterium]
MTQRWKQRPAGSNWGEFGPDDQRGRMNLVTREKVLQGIAEVKEGITFCLSLPLDYPGGSVLNPRRSPPRLASTVRDSGKNKGGQNFCYPFSEDDADLTDVVCDDVVLLTLQYSSQWDSLAHVGSRFDADGDGKAEIVFYNGWRAGEHIRPARENPSAEPWAKFEGTEARALGIQNLAEHGAQGRGVMIDLHAHFNRERKAVGYDDLMRVLEKDRVAVERGDMVCLYTGFADVILELKKKPDAKLLHGTCSGLDGRDDKLLGWITDSGLACLIADNYAVELIPASLTRPKPHAAMPLHEHCLFKNGIHLGEMWYLSELASWLRSHGRSRFLLTAPPLRLPGAVGSPPAPVATV